MIDHHGVVVADGARRRGEANRRPTPRPPARAARLRRVAWQLAALLAASLAALPGGPALADAPSAGEPVTAPGPLGPLAGTLLAPTTRSIATVLILPGSGPTDRDGNSPLGIRASTYRLLAQDLAAQGVTTLRIDKRGLFGSAAVVADPNAVTIADYVADVGAWVAVARAKTGAPCVWLLGHSEGGLVAMAAARRVPDLCGLVLVASPGRPMGELLREQLAANPANAPVLPQALSAIGALEHGRHVDTRDLHPALQRLFARAVQGYLIDAFSYDPRALVAGSTLPILIVQGQRDLQVSEADARRLQAADPQATLVLVPDANHVLKAVASADRQDNLAAYADPALPLAPGVVAPIAAFLARPPAATAP